MKTKNSAAWRNVLYSVLILAVMWSALYLGGVSRVHAQTTGAQVSLRADQTSFGASEDVILQVTITNPTAEPLQLLRWFAPGDGMEGQLFTVTRDGEAVSYIGPLFKRAAATEQDYITLQPGESLDGTVRLSAYYDLSASGNYSVTYAVDSPELYASQEKKLLKISGQLTSNELELSIEGRALPQLETIVPEAVPGSTSFVSCSANQQTELLSARNNASTYANGSLSYFNAGNPSARYTTWFGAYLLSRFNLAKSHFTNISNAMNNAAVTFDCTCTQTNIYAFVYKNQPYKIYLCGAFWSAPATGTDSKAGTLVHEMSHFTIVADTDDWAYGQTAARNLALSDPNKAVDNADSHEYFAENNPPIVNGDSFEPDNSSAEAKPIAIGVTQTHSIMPAGDVDWVKFVLTVPSAIVLETLPGQSVANTEMWLYNSSLQLLRYSDDEGIGAYSYINTCDVVNLPAGTYYVKIGEFGNNAEVTSYRLSVSAGNNCVYNYLAGTLTNMSALYPGASTRQSFAGANNGPVMSVNVDGNPFIAAERVIYKVNGVNTSFSELMGLPNSQLGAMYWLPWYDNVNMDTQLRIANVSASMATVTVKIGTVTMAPFNLAAGESTRKSFPGVNNGPVRIVSNQPIVVAERVIYKANGVNTSFSEMMAKSASQSDTTYWLPWYNNVDLDTQLRIANIDDMFPATVHVFIGGQEMQGSPFSLATFGSTHKSFAGVNAGPVQIVSDRPIVVSERVIYKVNGVNTSYSEMMALPNSQLNTTFWLPWYNNVDLDTQLRIGNVSNSTATVHVYIGGAEMPGSPFNLAPGASTRKSYPGVNQGPVRIVSNVNVIAAERVIYKVNGVNTSFTEMMGLPSPLLNTTYWFPWYNNVDLDTQLRFGVP